MIKQFADEFVSQQRALGFKYRVQGGLIKSYATFAQERGDTFIKVDRVIEWSALAPSSNQKRNRLLIVRRFALSAHAIDPVHEIPPADTYGRSTYRRRKPYIFTSEELSKLQQAALRMTPKESTRPMTFYTLLTLLWVSGLRISEALSLDVSDITEDGLLVRATKFRKNRVIPIHCSTRRALALYLKNDSRKNVAIDEAVFVSTLGTRLSYSCARTGFNELIDSVGLRGTSNQSSKCLHDMRHSFALRSLEQCPACAHTVKKHMVALSTYMGHAHITDTYWYLEATTGLTQKIAKLTEARHEEVRK